MTNDLREVSLTDRKSPVKTKNSLWVLALRYNLWKRDSLHIDRYYRIVAHTLFYPLYHFQFILEPIYRSAHHQATLNSLRPIGKDLYIPLSRTAPSCEQYSKISIRTLAFLDAHRQTIIADNSYWKIYTMCFIHFAFS